MKPAPLPPDAANMAAGVLPSCDWCARSAPASNSRTAISRFPVPAAVCRDAGGADLGGMLVAEGFALADPTQSYDYFSAEAAARQLRRGLWQYR